MLYRIECGCVLLVTDHRPADRREWKGRILESCAEPDRPYQIGPERTLAELFVSTDKLELLPVEDAQKLYDELGKLISDGYRFRLIAAVLKQAAS